MQQHQRERCYLLIMIGFVMSLLGCDSDNVSDTADSCTSMFWSTSIFIYDEDGVVPWNPEVEYSRNAGPIEEAVCSHLTDEGFCPLWHAGFDEPGTFRVRVAAPGYELWEDSVVVILGENGCNVVPVWVDARLVPATPD